jgi:hypothetical protein
MSKYESMNKDQLRAACKAAGLKYGKLSVMQQREALEALDAVDAAPAEPSAAEEALENDYSNFVAEVSEQRTDDAPAPAPEVPAEKPKAAPAPKAEQRNGIAKPMRGLTLDVWNACDALKTEGKETTLEALTEKLPAYNVSTIRTQRQRWKTYHG